MRWFGRALEVPPPPTPAGLRALTAAAWFAAIRGDVPGMRLLAEQALALPLPPDTAAVRADQHRCTALVAEAGADGGATTFAETLECPPGV